jgi:hypothetical protein
MLGMIVMSAEFVCFRCAHVANTGNNGRTHSPQRTGCVSIHIERIDDALLVLLEFQTKFSFVALVFEVFFCGFLVINYPSFQMLFFCVPF